ncbi:MAG: hypothetical protein ACTS5I_12520 [Rhodanobacter sp.]
MKEVTLTPNLTAAKHLPIDTDDELPPWLGERMRDTFHDIFRAADEAANDSEDAA